MYGQCGGNLPLGLHIQQDNCCREGKNVYLLRWCIMLVLCGITRWTTMMFLRSGHSHENIDQIFSQVCSVIKDATFDTPDALLSVMSRLCRTGREAAASGSQSVTVHATKLGQTALWQEWGNQLGVSFRGHAQRGSPHYFRVCRRADLGMPIADQGHDYRTESEVPITDFEHPDRSPDDIMLVTKYWMADAKPAQILAVVPAKAVSAIDTSRTGIQPKGVAARRPLSKATVDSINSYVPSLSQQGFVSPDAADYLLKYARGAVEHERRPEGYRFLCHRWRRLPVADQPPPVLYDGEEPMRGVKVVRLAVQGGGEPVAGDDDDGDVVGPVPLGGAE